MQQHSLSLSMTMPASVDRVWEAWTEAEQLKQWWGPDGVTISDCQLDVRPTGQLSIVMVAGPDLGDVAGSRWPMTGTYLEIVEPSTLVYSASPFWTTDKPFMDTLNALHLEPGSSPATTQLSFQVQVTEIYDQTVANNALQGMPTGWQQSLQKLVAYLSRS